MIRVFLKIFPPQTFKRTRLHTATHAFADTKKKENLRNLDACRLGSADRKQEVSRSHHTNTSCLYPASIFSPVGVFCFNNSSAYALPCCFRKCGLPLPWKPLVTFHKERKTTEGSEGEEPPLAMPPVGKTNETLEW